MKMKSKVILLILALIWVTGQISLKYLERYEPAFYYARLTRDCGVILLSVFVLSYMIFQLRLSGRRRGLLWYGFLFIFIQGVFGTSIILHRSVAVKLRDQANSLGASFHSTLRRVEAERRPKSETSQMREKLKDLIYETKKTETFWVKTITEINGTLTILVAALISTLVVSLTYPIRFLPRAMRLQD